MLFQSATVSNSVNHFIKVREIGKLKDLANNLHSNSCKSKVVILQKSGDLIFDRYL